MKIGTWNLAGRWNVGHRDLTAAADCDVWLLTEVNKRTELEGMHPHLSTGLMAPGRRWAAVVSDTGADLLAALPDVGLVWGGDWNHALCGPEHAGSMGGRNHLLAVVEELGLVVPTALLPHRVGGGLSIDHIAVGREQRVVDTQRIRAGGLSDHDAYVVSLAVT